MKKTTVLFAPAILQARRAIKNTNSVYLKIDYAVFAHEDSFLLLERSFIFTRGSCETTIKMELGP